MTAAEAYAEALRYGLEIPQDMRDASPADRAACWNGAGPERMPLIRAILTWALQFLLPAFLVHDWRFYRARGTWHDWRDANAQMERNCYALIRRKLRWWLIWRRPGLVAATEAARAAVDSDAGRDAYEAAYRARMAREMQPGPEVDG